MCRPEPEWFSRCGDQVMVLANGRTGILFAERQETTLCLQSVRTDVGTSRGVKRPGREFENLARHLALVKNKHLCSNTHLHGVVLNQRVFLTFWCRSYFLILAHSVYKYHGWALTVFSLTQHNTRHTPIVRHILSTARLTQYDMLPQHQVNI
jgi:hypothetical protein